MPIRKPRCALRHARLLLSALFCGLSIAAAGAIAPSALAAPTTDMVDLGQGSTYAAMSGASVANTVSAVGAPHTTLRGNLGVKVNATPTGFPPGEVTGSINIANSAAVQAHADLVAAYVEVEGRTGGTTRSGALAGQTISPGLWTITGAVSNTGTVTLDGGGDPNAVFVFQVGGALNPAAGSHVVLANGARASRVFWQVNGAVGIGANSDFAGTLMALDAVALGAGTLMNGRLFARNGALALDANEVYSAPPVVAITGGSTAITTDTTPTISGTTDVQGPVTVTVNGQTLTATPSGGAWSVTSALLANATYPVVASVTDGAGNPGSVTQQLTVDTVLPVVTIDGGASVTTNDSTPTVSGTSDVASGTVVRVSVGSQNLTALVQADGTWNVTPATLTDGTRTVTATVTDPAGNDGTDTQSVTVDTAAPAVTIAGGPNALTNDATPTISGTADVPSNPTVTVTLPDETLTAQVDNVGNWSVNASAIPDGPHRVVMAVSDSAGNRASTTQRLTIDTISPAVAINGGATATTDDLTPTITGTSNAAAGTTVTVSIAGQTMTTLLQANGTWNATPAAVSVGTWSVSATAPDPAGNVGSAGQVLMIFAAAPPPESTPPPAPEPTPEPTPEPAPVSAPATPPGSAPASAPPTSGGGSVNAAARTIVVGRSSQKTKRSSLSIATKVTAPAEGRVVVTATGSVKIKGVKKAIMLTSTTATLVAGKSATLTLKPKGTKKSATTASRSIDKAVSRGKQAVATITLKIRDAAGNTRSLKRTVILTRR